MNEERDIVLFRIDRKTGLLILAALGVVFGGFALAQQLTLTTSYPVPSGIYNQLLTTGNSGTVPADTTFNRNAGNTVLVPATNAGGKVGVGTSAPAVKLDVNGAMKLDNMSYVQGAACSPEGALSYDYSNHAPIYCGGTGKWQQPGGTYGGTFEAANHGTTCQAPNPFTHLCTCPAGYAAVSTWASDSSGTTCQGGMGSTNPTPPYSCANTQFLCHL